MVVDETARRRSEGVTCLDPGTAAGLPGSIRARSLSPSRSIVVRRVEEIAPTIITVGRLRFGGRRADECCSLRVTYRGVVQARPAQ